MCLNSMCPNFCVLYGSEDGPGSDDLRYRLVHEGGKPTKLHCRSCGMNVRLHSATSLREIARHFLSLSLPFADCPDEDCGNHGVNAFEFYGRSHAGNGRPYRKARNSELACNLCGKFFPIGEPLWLKDTRKVYRHSKRVLHSVSMGRPLSDAIDSGMKLGPYYRQLLRMGPRLRDYLSYRNAHLLKPQPGGAREQETALVYTDVYQAPIKRAEGGFLKGNQFKVIASAIRLQGTYYILAAHAYFLPDSKCPDLHGLEADKEKPHPPERRWDALRTFLDDPEMLDEKGEPPKEPPSDEGQPGREILTPYAEVAHFLVVDRMLSRFGRRYIYMDTSRDLFDSAMLAMRDSIRRRRVEIVLYQHDKEGRRAVSTIEQGERLTPAVLDRAFEKEGANFAQRLHDEMTSSSDKSEAEVRAIMWRQARNGGYSKAAKGVWLDFPPDYKNFVDCRTWWLTRRPGDTNEDAHEPLLKASMYSIDSAHGSMRSRVNALQRRGSISQGQGLKSNYYRFDVMCAEMWVYLLNFNCRLRKQDKRKFPRAVTMGLADKRDRIVRPHDVAWNFRLGIEHAEKISRWMKFPP